MCHISADPLQENWLLLLKCSWGWHLPLAADCLVKRKGSEWEGLDGRWWITTAMGPSVHSSHCRHRNRLCLCSHTGEFCPVWDSQYYERQFCGEDTQCFLVVGGVHQAVSVVQVLWVSRQDSRVKSVQCPEERTELLQLLKEMLWTLKKSFGDSQCSSTWQFSFAFCSHAFMRRIF